MEAKNPSVLAEKYCTEDTVTRISFGNARNSARVTAFQYKISRDDIRGI